MADKWWERTEDEITPSEKDIVINPENALNPMDVKADTENANFDLDALDNDASFSKVPSKPKSDFMDLNMVLSDLPADVVDNMPTIQNRIDAYLTYYSAMNLSRLPKLTQFIMAAEDVMFNTEDLLHMDFDQVKELYKNAKASAVETLETARKVSQSVQQERDKKTDALYNILTGLSPSSVAKLLEMVDDVKNDEPKNKG